MHKWGNVVLIVILLLASRLLAEVTHHVLECLVLLGANLLDDVGEHVLEFLNFTVSSDDEQVLAHGELNYNFKRVSYRVSSLRTDDVGSGEM